MFLTPCLWRSLEKDGPPTSFVHEDSTYAVAHLVTRAAHALHVDCIAIHAICACLTTVAMMRICRGCLARSARSARSAKIGMSANTHVPYPISLTLLPTIPIVCLNAFSVGISDIRESDCSVVLLHPHVLLDVSSLHPLWVVFDTLPPPLANSRVRARWSPGWGGGDGRQVTVSRGGGGGLQGYFKANCGTLH